MLNLNSYVLKLNKLIRAAAGRKRKSLKRTEEQKRSMMNTGGKQGEAVERTEEEQKRIDFDRKREEVLAVINGYMYDTDLSPLTYEPQIDIIVAADKVFNKIRKWHEENRTDLIEAALDVAANPPEDCFDHGWDGAVNYVLSFWVALDPEAWAKVAGPLLNNTEMRPIVLGVLAEANSNIWDAFRPLLMPFVLDPSQLSSDEQMYLAEAVSHIGGEESLQLQSQLATRVEPKRREVLEEVERRKKWVTKNMKDK